MNEPVERWPLLTVPYGRTEEEAVAAALRLAGRSGDAGVHTGRKWFKDYVTSLGFSWTPTMAIGQGTTVHLREGEQFDAVLTEFDTVFAEQAGVRL